MSYHLARGFAVPLPLLRWHARASYASIGQEKDITNEKKEGDVLVAVGVRPYGCERDTQDLVLLESEH